MLDSPQFILHARMSRVGKRFILHTLWVCVCVFIGHGAPLQWYRAKLCTIDPVLEIPIAQVPKDTCRAISLYLIQEGGSPKPWYVTKNDHMPAPIGPTALYYRPLKMQWNEPNTVKQENFVNFIKLKKFKCFTVLKEQFTELCLGNSLSQREKLSHLGQTWHMGVYAKRCIEITV